MNVNKIIKMMLPQLLVVKKSNYINLSLLIWEYMPPGDSGRNPSKIITLQCDHTNKHLYKIINQDVN